LRGSQHVNQPAADRSVRGGCGGGYYAIRVCEDKAPPCGHCPRWEDLRKHLLRLLDGGCRPLERTMQAFRGKIGRGFE
jgi:hypothetical protein